MAGGEHHGSWIICEDCRREGGMMIYDDDA